MAAPSKAKPRWPPWAVVEAPRDSTRRLGARRRIFDAGGLFPIRPRRSRGGGTLRDDCPPLAQASLRGSFSPTGIPRHLDGSAGFSLRPRVRTSSVPFGSGRCGFRASSGAAVIQVSTSSGVVRITGVAFGWMAPTSAFGSVVRNAIVGGLAFLDLPDGTSSWSRRRRSRRGGAFRRVQTIGAHGQETAQLAPSDTFPILFA